MKTQFERVKNLNHTSFIKSEEQDRMVEVQYVGEAWTSVDKRAEKFSPWRRARITLLSAGFTVLPKHTHTHTHICVFIEMQWRFTSPSFPDRSQQFSKIKSTLHQTTCQKSNRVMRTTRGKTGLVTGCNAEMLGWNSKSVTYRHQKFDNSFHIYCWTQWT